MNKFRTLGLSGLRVSAVGLGCMGMSHAYGKPADKEEMIHLLSDAVDMGYTFFDTAEVYGTLDNPHHNELLLGEALRFYRNNIVIATKFGLSFDNPEGAGPHPLIPDARPETIRKAVEGAFHRFAVLDSDLTLTLPMKQVISGAFDTLSHCMETYMGQPFETNVSDEINETIMRNVIKNIRTLIDNPDDDFARGELMWDSAMAENGMLKLDRSYLPEGTPKLARMAREVWGVKDNDDISAAKEGIDLLENFIEEIGMPTWWSQMGITDEKVMRDSADT